MKINLQDIVIQNIPDKPTKIWDSSPQKVFHDYKVFGYFRGQEVGHITVSLCQYSTIKDDINDFWFEKKRKIWIPRPVAVFQGTENPYRGKGVSGEMLIMVNELVKERFNRPLASDTTFCENYFGSWNNKNYAKRPAMRVWEKLEEKGLAYSKPYKGNPRWIMY